MQDTTAAVLKLINAMGSFMRDALPKEAAALCPAAKGNERADNVCGCSYRDCTPSKADEERRRECIVRMYFNPSDEEKN